jgi:hypothetical protein
LLPAGDEIIGEVASDTERRLLVWRVRRFAPGQDENPDKHVGS